tara:strand:+ start:1700 stop:1927 length:228 start_codon:yes stop_codon:yes gene_type:complete
MKIYLIPLIAILSVFYINGQSQNSLTSKYSDVSLNFETPVINLVAQMTLVEKISHLGNSSPAITRLGIHKKHCLF